VDSEIEAVLFYPHPFNIHNIQLVKTSALYWDEIRFITSDYEREWYEHHSLENEASSLGILKPYNIHKRDPFVEKAGRELLNDLDENPEIVDDIYKQGRHSEKYIDIEIMPLHIDKISLQYLTDINSHLIKRKVSLVPIDQNTVAVPIQLFEMYISRLASIIAQNDDIALLTDKISCQNAALSRFIDYFDERKQNQSHLANLSLQTISIPTEVPLADVVKFRDRHRNMLLRFRGYIRELSRQVSQGLDDTKKQCVIEEIIKDKILPSNEEIKGKLLESNIAFGFSALDITQATAIGMIASQGENLLAGIGAGLISLTISFVQSLREDRKCTKEHPLGYLYRAQKEFGVKN